PRGLMMRTFCYGSRDHLACPSFPTRRSSDLREAIGGIAMPDKIQIVDGLPKTRSGKIMRRILRKIAEGEPENVGDVTTLADPAVDRKSTRLNSSHVKISYAVFCLKKKRTR